MVQRKKDHHILKRLAVGTEDRKARDLFYVNNKSHLVRAPHGEFCCAAINDVTMTTIAARDSEDESEEEGNFEDEEEIESMDVAEDIDVSEVIHSKAQEATQIKTTSKVEIAEMS